MSAPERIYIVERKPDDNSLMICSTNSSDQNGKRPEYIKAPVVKRFKDERPVKSGQYLVKASYGYPQCEWEIGYYLQNKNIWKLAGVGTAEIIEWSHLILPSEV